MNVMVSAINAQQMIDIRDAMRGICGENYGRAVMPYKNALRLVMEKTGTEPLPAMLRIYQDMQAELKPGMLMGLTAAAVEVIDELATEAREKKS